MNIEIMDFDKRRPKCKHCGKERGNHQAVTFICPVGRGSFPSFPGPHSFEPRIPKGKRGMMTEAEFNAESEKARGRT